MSKLLTVAETAARLGRSEKAFRYQIHKGTAPKSAMVMGRRLFRDEDVDAWLNAQFEKERA